MLLAGGLAVAAAYCAPLRLAVVSGQSMTPTLKPGQPLVYSATRPTAASLQRGEVVLVRLGGQVCVKRIFALGRDRFWTVANGPGQLSLLDPNVSIRKWRRRFPHFPFRRYQVPKDYVFVVGDGLGSLDSRELGPVAASDVVGRVVFPAEEGLQAPAETNAFCSMPAAPPHARG